MQRMRLDLENQIAGRPPALLDLGRYRAGDPPRVRPRIREPEGRDAVGHSATAFVGIDVSKDTLDACLLLPGGTAKERAFANDPRGHAALAAWADRHAEGHSLHFCMEATGPYSEAPATHLADAGHLVSVANPTRVKHDLYLSPESAKSRPHIQPGNPANKRPWRCPPVQWRGLPRRLEK